MKLLSSDLSFSLSKRIYIQEAPVGISICLPLIWMNFLLAATGAAVQSYCLATSGRRFRYLSFDFESYYESTTRVTLPGTDADSAWLRAHVRSLVILFYFIFILLYYYLYYKDKNIIDNVKNL